jgi:hypothetical protein
MTSTNNFRSISSAILVGLCACLVPGQAQADIGKPGGHHEYSAEIEPHLVLQWADEPSWNDEGIGLGLRASIPLIQNGPVTTINNSLAIGFGLDWAHFDDECFGPFPNRNVLGRDCSANDFWIPVVVQWNFFFSDVVSAFPELGVGIQHTRFDGTWCVENRNATFCDDGGSDTDVELVLWLGVRFHLSQAFAITLRLGTPSLLLGASFFL